MRLTKSNQEQGFTLLELAVVMLIAAGTIVMISRFIEIYLKVDQQETTIENLRMAQDALDEYYGLFGVYPCPADPTLPSTDANYGQAQCRDFANAAFDADGCDNTPGNIVCTTNGTRDADENGADDVVMIGALPFRLLYDEVKDTEFREHHKMDGYNLLITYAVTENMTNTDLYDAFTPASPHIGTIRVIDENNIDIISPANSAHMVVLSHGENRKGGYSTNGSRPENCFILDINGDEVEIPAGLPAAGMDIELENCDETDGIFLSGIMSHAQGDGYNDDILFFNVAGFVNLWEQSLEGNDGETFIYNTNFGNVGIGTDDPTNDLHVKGNISVKGSVQAEKYCEETDTAICVEPKSLAGLIVDGGGMTCLNDNEVVYAIQNSGVECRSVDWASVAGKTCPATSGGDIRFMTGISNLGNLRCCTEDELDCCTYDGTTCEP